MSVPTVTGIDPTGGPAGTQVVITGSGFTEEASAVRFGAASAGTQFAVVSASRIIAYVPACSGAVHVTVTTPGGTSAATSADLFTCQAYIGPPGESGAPPTVTSVVPNTAADNDGGDVIAVNGTHLATALSVRFGLAAESPQGTFTVVSDAELEVTTPPGSDTVDVIVTTSYGQSAASSADEYTYPDAAPPTVSAIAPAGGYYGSRVVITGTNFDTVDAVYFGDEPAPFTATLDTSIEAYAPEGSGAVHVTAHGVGGTSAATSADLFSYGTGALPKTTATNLQQSGYTGWSASPVTVTLTASANGGYGVAATYYTVDGGGITPYAGPFTVSAPGSHLVKFWSVDTRGNVEPVNTGWVNILSASTVPTGLTLTPGIGFIAARWDNVVSLRPVTYKVYIGSSNPPTTLYANSGANVVTIKRANADGLTYVAVSTVDVAGNESGKCTAASATAIGAAADLADHEISQSKLALDIRPPAIVASLPGLPATEYPAGATVYLTSDSCLYKTTNGTTWVKLVGSGELQDGCVVFGKIAAAAVGANEIASDSVFARNLVVADFDNLVPNSNSELPITGHNCRQDSEEFDFRGVMATSYSYSSGSYARVVGGTWDGSQTNYTVSKMIPWSPADESGDPETKDVFRFTAMARCNAAETVGCCIQLSGYDKNGVYVSGSARYSAYNKTTTYAKLVVEWSNDTDLNNVQYVAARLRFDGQTGEWAYFDNLYFRRKGTGSLIVDGSITADQIAANTITANEVNVTNLTAAVVTADAINAASVAATVSLSAPTITGSNISGATITGTSTITGAVLQTSSDTTKNRIVISGATSALRDRISFKASGLSDSIINIGTDPSGRLGAGYNVLSLLGPTYTNDGDVDDKTVPQLTLGQGYLTTYPITYKNTFAELHADFITLDASSETTRGAVYVSGALIPKDDWDSGTSKDGIWIQDNSTVTRRHKLYYNSSNKRFGVYDHNGTPHYVTLS